MTALFSYFYETLGLYLAKLFAFYLLFGITRSEAKQEKATSRLQHYLRTSVLYTAGFLIDEYLAITRGLTTLWPYWFMLVVTTRLSRNQPPIVQEVLSGIDDGLGKVKKELTGKVETEPSVSDSMQKSLIEQENDQWQLFWIVPALIPRKGRLSRGIGIRCKTCRFWSLHGRPADAAEPYSSPRSCLVPVMLWKVYPVI